MVRNGIPAAGLACTPTTAAHGISWGNDMKGIRLVMPSEVPDAWRTAAPIIDRAFKRSQNETAYDHLIPLLNDQEQLWEISNGNAWAITRVVRGRNGLVLQYIALAGGEMAHWISDFQKASEQWGVSVGCTSAIWTGRKGWKKFLPEYKQTHVTCIKELSYV